MGIEIGDTVKWSTGRKPLGKVVHLFAHRGQQYAVVEHPDDDRRLQVVRVYEKLVRC